MFPIADQWPNTRARIKPRPQLLKRPFPAESQLMRIISRNRLFQDLRSSSVLSGVRMQVTASRARSRVERETGVKTPSPDTPGEAPLTQQDCRVGNATGDELTVQIRLSRHSVSLPTAREPLLCAGHRMQASVTQAQGAYGAAREAGNEDIPNWGTVRCVLQVDLQGTLGVMAADLVGVPGKASWRK